MNKVLSSFVDISGKHKILVKTDRGERLTLSFKNSPSQKEIDDAISRLTKKRTEIIAEDGTVINA